MCLKLSRSQLNQDKHSPVENVEYEMEIHHRYACVLKYVRQILVLKNEFVHLFIHSSTFKNGHYHNSLTILFAVIRNAIYIYIYIYICVCIIMVLYSYITDLTLIWLIHYERKLKLTKLN